MAFGQLRQLVPLSLIAFAHGALATTSARAADEAKVAAVSAPAVTETAANREPEKPEVALGGDHTRTRFLIGLEKPVEYQVFSLSNPNRVIVELPDVKIHLPQDTGGKPVGLVNSFRGGLSAPGKARIVIDVAAPVVVETAKIEKVAGGKEHRLALEIVPVDALSKTARKPLKSQPFALGAAGLQPPLPQRAVRPSEKAAKAFKPVIVIDPGHGGHDSGAEKNGVVEKDAVLAFSKRLKAKLESTGRYKVMMTRETDVFIELDARRDFGETHNAALFIAVHADYASTKARGATIYSLRSSVANALERSAKDDAAERALSKVELETVKETSSAGDADTVKDILADLAEREVDVTQQRTSIFSRAVIENMGETTSMRDDPDQQAAFRVLKTAQFPSVLIELAYVTNKEDAENLKSDTWRDKVADSITSAVENYFSHQLARLPM